MENRPRVGLVLMRSEWPRCGEAGAVLETVEADTQAIVERRGRIGDWEVDTVMGSGSSSCLLTLVERKSGFTLVRKLKARTMAEATNEAAVVIQRMRHKFQTITFDNGTEFHDYERLERLFGVTCYFATPYHSWERGSNENLNGLVRQYYLRAGPAVGDLQGHARVLLNEQNRLSPLFDL